MHGQMLLGSEFFTTAPLAWAGGGKRLLLLISPQVEASAAARARGTGGCELRCAGRSRGKGAIRIYLEIFLG